MTLDPLTTDSVHSLQSFKLLPQRPVLNPNPVFGFPVTNPRRHPVSYVFGIRPDENRTRFVQCTQTLNYCSQLHPVICCGVLRASPFAEMVFVPENKRPPTWTWIPDASTVDGQPNLFHWIPHNPRGQHFILSDADFCAKGLI